MLKHTHNQFHFGGQHSHGCDLVVPEETDQNLGESPLLGNFKNRASAKPKPKPKPRRNFENVFLVLLLVKKASWIGVTLTQVVPFFNRARSCCFSCSRYSFVTNNNFIINNDSSYILRHNEPSSALTMSLPRPHPTLTKTTLF